MASYILLVWAGIISSVPAGLFLFFYYQLIRTANQTTGKIVSFDRSNFMIFREILVPIVRFKTQDDSFIEGQPEYSLFHEMNGFVRNSNVTVYYLPDRPENFVIACKTEVVVNWVVLAVTGCLIVGLFIC